MDWKKIVLFLKLTRNTANLNFNVVVLDTGYCTLIQVTLKVTFKGVFNPYGIYHKAKLGNKSMYVDLVLLYLASNRRSTLIIALWQIMAILNLSFFV
jgi:hypothetical protein